MPQTLPSTSATDPRARRAAGADARAAALVAQLTQDEKLQLVQGEIFMRMNPETGKPEPTPGSIGGDGYVQGVPRLGIPDLQINGSGLGVTNLGARPDGAATVLASSLALASSWNPQLAYQAGEVIGRQTRDQGFNVSIGGGVNLTREAWGGRNFEYHGEDPLLAGRLVAQTLLGSQDQDLVATIKHYAANSQETGRMVVNSVLDERALRESELLAFEIGVRDSGVGVVMCSYNKLNGCYACENGYLLNDVLKGEWSFKGWVMSDWGATHSTVEAANGGLDQEVLMPRYFGDALRQSILRGEVPQARLDDMVHRILRTMIACGVMDHPPVEQPLDFEAGALVAQREAEEGSVLLRNANALLPLDPDAPLRIALIGGHADRAVLTGAGSGQVKPRGGSVVKSPPAQQGAGALSPDFTSQVWVGPAPLRAIAARAPRVTVKFADGDDHAAAARLAQASDIAIVFATQHRSESLDVPSVALPDGQDALITAVAAVNPQTVVVLETGGAVLTPWADQVGALLVCWYPGERGGEALARLLFGDVNPSGKLPLTFPASEDQLPRRRPAGEAQGSVKEPQPFDAAYPEGANVGYKWYDARNLTPSFPFGFGLSYTRFEYQDLRMESVRGQVRASFSLRNAGERPGFEVAQAYVRPPQGTSDTVRRLAGWARVYLKPGEERRVTVTLEPLVLAHWSVEARAWHIPDGVFTLEVGRSSRDLPLSAVFEPEEARPAQAAG